VRTVRRWRGNVDGDRLAELAPFCPRISGLFR
jgi:hypothetical protein